MASVTMLGLLTEAEPSGEELGPESEAIFTKDCGNLWAPAGQLWCHVADLTWEGEVSLLCVSLSSGPCSRSERGQKQG